MRAVILEDPPSAAYLANLRNTPYFAQFTEVKKLAGQNRPIRDIAQSLSNILLPQPNGPPVRMGALRVPTDMRYVASCLRDVDPGVYDPVLDGSWMRGYDEAAIWKAIKCPALLMRGEEARGGMFPTADADRMAATIADCTRVDVPGGGHLLHWLSIETCVRLTLGFLESL